MSDSRNPMLAAELDKLCDGIATELAHAQRVLIEFKAAYDALTIKACDGRRFPNDQLDDAGKEVVFDSLASHPAKAKSCLHEALREVEAARFCGAALIAASEVRHA